MQQQTFDNSIITERQKKLWGYDETPLFILILIAIYILVAQIIPNYVIVPVNVIGGSMEPTLYENDRVLLFKQGSIDYGDIVVVYAPNVYNNITNEMGEDIIKRVMGKPGDSVWFEKETIDSNTHYIFHRQHEVNGMLIETALTNEYYVLKDSNGNPLYAAEALYSETKVVLADDEYFVMGDNRGNSLDSRYTLQNNPNNYVGKVKKSDIKGKALLIIRNGMPILFNKVNY